ncbi:MAG: hypothetical protein ACK4RS_02230, partial [Thiothrix sp.]
MVNSVIILKSLTGLAFAFSPAAKAHRRELLHKVQHPAMVCKRLIAVATLLIAVVTLQYRHLKHQKNDFPVNQG